MNVAVKSLDFERAIELRDEIGELQSKLGRERLYSKQKKAEKIRTRVYERTRKTSHAK